MKEKKTIFVPKAKETLLFYSENSYSTFWNFYPKNSEEENVPKIVQMANIRLTL